MKSSIKVDVDLVDKPIIRIKSVHTSDDLRDKSLCSFLKKLGMAHAQWNQEALIQVQYNGWGGSEGGDCSEEWVLRPVEGSAKILEEGKSILDHYQQTGEQKYKTYIKEDELSPRLNT